MEIKIYKAIVNVFMRGRSQQNAHCPAKPVVTENLCVVQREGFSITCYMCGTYTCRKAKHIHKGETHFVREDVNLMAITAKVQLKNISGRESQGAVTLVESAN
jgi:hypothetical protein